MYSLLLAATLANPWAVQHSPAAGTAEPIGGYSAGCLQGGQPFPLETANYQVLRPQQHRYFGHPELLSFLDTLTKSAHQHGLPPLLIGDMAMVRGGPFTSGHASHQTGLDADIWFRFAQPRLTPAQIKDPVPVDMVASDNRHVSPAFTAQQQALLKLAASDPRVERIFVHPAIKQALCEQTTGDRSWLHRLRPWFGHRAHFHIRLACPAGATDCEVQKPIPAGDGCGAEVESWFTGGSEISSKPGPRKMPVLPARCEQLLQR